MNPSTSKDPYKVVLELISSANQLAVKAINAPTSQNLNFIILNDTLRIAKYDRAVLWRIVEGRPTILGVSGQTTFSTSSEIVNRWKDLVSAIPDPSKSKLLSADDFPENAKEWSELQKKTPASILWWPIKKDENSTVGLWLEKWEDGSPPSFTPERIKVLDEYLAPAYAGAWDKISSHARLDKLRKFLTKTHLSIVGTVLLFGSLLIHVPLRVVAPCEVVPKDPYVITAPMEGIIDHVTVRTGQSVKKGEILYEYDTRIPLQELKVAQKQVEIIQSELNKTIASGVNEERSLLELATLNIKLQKGVLDLEYAKSRARDLLGKSPKDGVASVDNPDDWRGKPVKVGEKILVISDPTQTKLKIWIPENDNIALDNSKPIKVFLNTEPEKSYSAKLIFISQETMVTENYIHSFIAEAEWEDPQPQVKLGVKGSAILYGENVSVLYYILRKPLSTLRTFLGV